MDQLKYDLHPSETDRLRALKELDLLDTVSEAEYDQITYLASQICQTPIALITLIDHDRQWFKSKLGIEGSETTREHSFCTHAILQEDIFEVRNSLEDQRFSTNPYVVGDPRVVFYAGSPIKDPSTNLPLGTLCVIDHKARELTEAQKKSLEALSAQVTRLLDLRKKVHALKKTSFDLEYMKLAFQNMSEGVVIQDAHGSIVDFNPSAPKILGLSREQLLGKDSYDPLWRAIREDGSPFPGEEHPAIMALTTGKPQYQTLMGIKVGSAKLRWIQINAVPVFIDNPLSPSHAVATFADVTELRETQGKLLDSSKTTAYAEMASSMAHEINNPLTIINGAASLMLKSLDGNSVEKTLISDGVGVIHQTVRRIADIIKALQHFSDKNKDEKNTRTDLKVFVSEILSLHSENFTRQGISVENCISEATVVQVNYTQLGHVFQALLKNSVEAVQTGPHKWIRIEAQKSSDKTILRIIDSGPGVPEHLIETMYQPFVTSKSATKNTGLGLTMAKSLTESMGGKISYQSESANTSFCIELPSAI